MTLPDLTFEAAFGVPPSEAQSLLLDGVATEYASTPDAASLDITGDIDVEWWGALDWQSASAQQTLIAKHNSTGDERSWWFNQLSGSIRLALSDDGTSTGLGDVAWSYRAAGAGLADGETHGVRFTWQASDGRIQFFLWESGAWVLKATRTLDIGSLHDSSAPLTVGAKEGAAPQPLDGRVLRCVVRDGIGGTVVASPDFSMQPRGTTSFDDAQGNTWTLQGDAEIDLPWVDLTDRLHGPDGVSWSYGRQTELDRMEAGTGSVTLDSADRALDPANEDSPYHPLIRPMVRVRFQALHQGTNYTVCEAFVEGWAPEWHHPAVARTVIPLVDGTKLLALARTSAAYSEEASGTRIGNLLDAADWPGGERDLDSGQSDVQAYTASDRIVLDAIRDAAAAEDGVFFIAPDGVATYRDRLSRVVGDVVATFGDSGAELPYAALELSYDDTVLWNDVSITPGSLSVQRAEDGDSVVAYGRRSLTREGTLHTTELEALDAANWLVRRYKDPRLRVESILLEGHQDDDVMTQILERRPGDRILVKRRPPGGGDPIEQESVIEHVSHSVRDMEWVTAWWLSPANTESVWLLETAGSSELNESTFLGY